MQRTILGTTGLDVPVFAVGTAPLARIPDALARHVLRRAVELGASWWDTSDDYGTHPLVGGMLAGYPRREIVISTKTHAHTREDGEVSVRKCLFELGTDYLDLLFLHFVRDSADFDARAGCLEALVAAKAAGRIRAIGFSSHFPEPLLQAAAHPDIDVIMAPWNTRGELPSGGSLRDMERAIHACYRAGKGVILMKVLAAGRLYPQLDTAIHGAARFPEKHALVIGVESARELETDIRLTLGQPVDANVLRMLKGGTGWGKAA